MPNPRLLRNSHLLRPPREFNPKCNRAKGCHPLLPESIPDSGSSPRSAREGDGLRAIAGVVGNVDGSVTLTFGCRFEGDTDRATPAGTHRPAVIGLREVSARNDAEYAQSRIAGIGKGHSFRADGRPNPPPRKTQARW